MQSRRSGGRLPREEKDRYAINASNFFTSVNPGDNPTAIDPSNWDPADAPGGKLDEFFFKECQADEISQDHVGSSDATAPSQHLDSQRESNTRQPSRERYQKEDKGSEYSAQHEEIRMNRRRPRSAHMVAPVPAVFYFERPHHKQRHGVQQRAFSPDRNACESRTVHQHVQKGKDLLEKSSARPKSARMSSPRPKSAALPRKMNVGRGVSKAASRRPKSAAPAGRRSRSLMMQRYHDRNISMKSEANSRLHHQLTALELKRPVLQFHRRSALMEDESSKSSVTEIALKAQAQQLNNTLEAHKVFTAVLSAVVEAIQHPLRAEMNERTASRSRVLPVKGARAYGLGSGPRKSSGTLKRGRSNFSADLSCVTTHGEKRFLSLLRQLLINDGGASVPWSHAIFALFERIRMQSPEDFRDPHVAVAIFALLEAAGIKLNTYKSWCRRRHVALPHVASLEEAKTAAARASMASAAMFGLKSWTEAETDDGNDGGDSGAAKDAFL